MLKNAYFLAKIGADTAENERNFVKKIAEEERLLEVLLLRLQGPRGLHHPVQVLDVLAGLCFFYCCF